MKATAKKAICILISGAALGMAAPAFADRGHDHWDRSHHYGHYYGGYYGPRYYAPRVVVAPAPVYYGAYDPYYAPAYYAPGYYAPASGAVVGAAAGALIGNRLGHRGDRVATTAAGAVIGGILGSGL